jgi:hypothetical protein
VGSSPIVSTSIRAGFRVAWALLVRASCSLRALHELVEVARDRFVLSADDVLVPQRGHRGGVTGHAP